MILQTLLKYSHHRYVPVNTNDCKCHVNNFRMPQKKSPNELLQGNKQLNGPVKRNELVLKCVAVASEAGAPLRTRADPLGEVWETEVVPMLRWHRRSWQSRCSKNCSSATPNASTRRCFAHCSAAFANGALNTATNEKSSSHSSIRQADLVCRTSRLLTSSACALKASTCHTGCTSSRLRTAAGDMPASCSAARASQALAAALWMAGGVPEEHRTDSLSAAFNNLAEQEELTARYRELCAHYGLRASRNNPGVSHENGAIEARQGSLKVALDQALLLRGTREFASLEGYAQFVAETVRRLNARCTRAWEVERVALQALPARRTDFQEIDVRVSSSGSDHRQGRALQRARASLATG